MGGQGKSKKKNGGGVKGNGKNGKSGKGGNGGKGGKSGKGSKKTSRGSKRSGGKARFAMDIFNEEVMENAYYTCHNIMDVLKCRGFPWPEAQKKKKKGKKN
ncbi:small lysine-rich protein 1 [Cephus cinctus]|uniref:Small lysine-rich protein 1 n=1 Tax=Cephus cinctus TaxID=211228 RepID=A0AAJ7R891_CEPCN|nr:small lysine-rich protein 1 [Cephus cinctus]XP_024935701.1 small lysine-rich protein 1 [Cephus cinctus]